VLFIDNNIIIIVVINNTYSYIKKIIFLYILYIAVAVDGAFGNSMTFGFTRFPLQTTDGLYNYYATGTMPQFHRFI